MTGVYTRNGNEILAESGRENFKLLIFFKKTYNLISYAAKNGNQKPKKKGF